MKRLDLYMICFVLNVFEWFKVNYTSISFSVVLALFSSSCLSPRYYTPNRIPVPLFKNKGDYYIDASSNFINKGDLTFGYAFNRGLAAYAGAGFSLESTSSFILRPEFHYSSEGQLLNFGLGYYLNNFNSNGFRFEIFSDMVLGRIGITKFPGYDEYHRQLGNTAYLSGNYRKIGLLSNIAFASVSKPMEYGYSVRAGKLNFYNLSFKEKQRLEGEINSINYNPHYFLIEHGGFLRYGRKVSLQLQFSIYHGLYSNPELSPVQGLNMSMLLGVVIKPKLRNL